jgi:hypothetical protein
MHTISIDASPAQLRKLRKGIKVRVKKGTGFNLIVHPETYNRVSRAFAKNKGLDITNQRARQFKISDFEWRGEKQSRVLFDAIKLNQSNNHSC